MLGFESRVALRFLREGRMQTLLIIVGVAAGVAVVAYITALISGLQANTLAKTLGAQPHVTLKATDDVVRPALAAAPASALPAAPAASAAVLAAVPAAVPVAPATPLAETQARAQRLRTVANWQALVPLLEREPGVAAVSPMVSGAGLAQRAEATKSIALMGVDLDRYDRIVGLRAKVVAGSARLGPGEAIVGRELANDLGVRIGDRITIATGSPGAGGPVSDSVRLTALVDLGVRDLNRRTVIVPLRAAQSLLGLPGGATVVDVALHDPWQAERVAADWSRRWPYLVESWQQANAQLVSALNAQSVSTGLIRGVVMVVVVLGIASVLVVSVVQKRREIGILRAMGATRGQMLRVFLLQGLVVGAAGSVLGVALAVGMVAVFVRFVRGSDGLPLFALTMPPLVALQVALIATVCGVIAAVAPARRAARLDPAEAIRL